MLKQQLQKYFGILENYPFSEVKNWISSRLKVTDTTAPEWMFSGPQAHHESD
jgi:hypothetical protein